MKISYIIAPFKDPEYLIRCVNSLYRQIGGGYEVILAENDFGEDRDKLEKFFEEKRRLIRISRNAGSREEKLAEAVKLLPADSDYVMLVDVNTVTAPIAAQAILGCRQADLIVPAAVVREGEEFLLDAPDEIALMKRLGEYVPDRFCFSREYFAAFAAEVLLEQRNTSDGWILEKLPENPAICRTRDVCLYMEKVFKREKAEVKAEQLQAVMAKTADSLEKIGSIKIKLGVVGKLTADYLDMMDKDRESAASVFMAFQKLCGGCRDSLVLSRLVEQRAGCRPEELADLSLEEYELFRNRLMEVDGGSLTAASAVPDKALSEIQSALEELKRDTAAIKLGQGMDAPASPGFGFADPVRDIPRMYREGRLGLRTILRSLKGWLGYKLCRE